MKKCSICGKPLISDDPLLLFYSEEQESYLYCCDECEVHITSLTEQSNTQDIQKAKAYFAPYISKLSQSDVKAFLVDLIPKEKKPEVESATRITAAVTSPPSMWISGMRIFSGILFAAIILIGILLAASLSGGGTLGALLGFVALLASFVIAFLTVGMTMVFLGIATDLHEINQKLS